MKKHVKKTIAACIIASAFTGFVVSDFNREVNESIEEPNAVILNTEFNGTTAWMLYQIHDTIYLFEKGGYGLPEITIWSEEDAKCN